jgi:hypothetical protein
MINISFFNSFSKLLFSLIDVLAIIVPVLLAIAFMTILERKQLAAHQRRVGPAKRSGKMLSWVKLSNSGDTLKLIVPSYILKFISGWSNYSGKVISYKMKETEMGYRGSKSNLKTKFVKEQRADGSLCFKPNHIRCALMGCENSYRIKFPSKQLNIRKFNTLNNKPKLNPWFTTGLIDGEGSFITATIRNNNYKIGWRVESKFKI